MRLSGQASINSLSLSSAPPGVYVDSLLHFCLLFGQRQRMTSGHSSVYSRSLVRFDLSPSTLSVTAALIGPGLSSWSLIAGLLHYYVRG